MAPTGKDSPLYDWPLTRFLGLFPCNLKRALDNIHDEQKEIVQRAFEIT